MNKPGFDSFGPICPETEWPESLRTAVQVALKSWSEVQAVPFLLVHGQDFIHLDIFPSKDAVADFLRVYASIFGECCNICEAWFAEGSTSENISTYIGNLEACPGRREAVVVTFESKFETLMGRALITRDPDTLHEMVVRKVKLGSEATGRFAGFFNKEKNEMQ
jgi:hypothetical protein